ncbi:MAG: bifunctional (p)ppGpp synthetase/guanosine-3',5'-bis(diphosphate) 3'-pyrophosphohydrolase [Selenomonadaceae bacterium]|nr:bifunctional (p)ppGpp synthetase/guanosine-3',5'-bis(diphosphate) 3'-pyrophosphohydrolase [Selenomonadaceae bacterium]
MNDKGKPPVTIKFLMDTVKNYQPDADLDLIERAYLVAKEGHAGQVRASGEPYINHPLNVAAILAELQLDDTTIAAAILHDVVEDTLFTLDEIKDMFGEEIALLIDGVTKIGQIYFKTKEQQQIEAYRKLIIATAKDLRVILIKLADRLHNMRTLKFMREDKRKRIAKETMELYAPLANRLGISNIKWELEDLCLRYLEPDVYYDLVEHVKQKRRERQIYISEAVRLIEEEFDELEIHASISGRAKHFYSIYKKTMRDHKDIGEIYDLSAVRILVDDVKDCYNVLGVIHSKWRPIPGRFKDYIAMPKSNGYRSLHTTVMALGYPLEIQIRTFAMHKISEYGVAAHWKYKESGSSKAANSDKDQKISWLRKIAQLQKEIKDPKEYLETLKLDFFSDEVFVFTPGKDLVVLPKGSTPIDFAYRIHTEVGHHCVGAKVNGRIVPLEYKLQNGDFVEVVTNKANNGPSRDWLNIVAASDTRSKIRAWFKRENREENVAQGRAMIEAELKKLGYNPKDLLKENRLTEVTKRMGVPNEEDLLAGVGYGGASPHTVVTKLVELHKKDLVESTTPDISALLAEVKKKPARGNQSRAEHGILVEGESGFVVRLARCCNPIPGDEIAGYITRGRGVSVHRADCPNILNGTGDMERMIEVSWEETGDKLYNVEVEIVCEDKSGVLVDLIAVPAEMNLNLHSIHATPNKNNKTSTVKLGVEVSNAAQLETLMNKLRRAEKVYSVTRPMKFAGGE